MKLDKPLNLSFEITGQTEGTGVDFLRNSILEEPAVSENVVVPDDVLELWALGDWSSLAKLDNASLPEQDGREYLAILAAMGYQYLDDEVSENRCIQLALKWGASRYDVKTMLLSAIYNRLGRASVLANDEKQAVKYFRQSLATTVLINGNTEQYLRKRIEAQLSDMSQDDLEKTLKAI